MKCPHDGRETGHYAVVEYRCIDNTSHKQQYWFCHSCAHKVYDDEPQFIPKES